MNAFGIVSNYGVILEVDLTGAVPSASYFSNGLFYSYGCFNFLQSKSIVFDLMQDGDIMKIELDWNQRKVHFDLNGSNLGSFEIARDFNKPLFVAVTLSANCRCSFVSEKEYNNRKK